MIVYVMVKVLHNAQTHAVKYQNQICSYNQVVEIHSIQEIIISDLEILIYTIKILMGIVKMDFHNG